jgi:hypothetical protein
MANINTNIGSQANSIFQSRIDIFNNSISNFVRNSTSLVKGQNFDVPLEARAMVLRVLDLNGVSGAVPDVVLPVNPDKFDVTFKKKSSLIYTMGSFVTQHWHDDVISIDATGMIPSFANQAKIIASSYQAFLRVVDVYTKCGQITVVNTATTTLQTFTTDKNTPQVNSLSNSVSEATDGTFSTNTTKLLTTRQLLNASVQLLYQDLVYTGIFQNFMITESYEQPNTLVYKFNFVAAKKESTLLGSLADAFNTLRQVGLAESTPASTLTLDSANRFIKVT